MGHEHVWKTENGIVIFFYWMINESSSDNQPTNQSVNQNGK